jgi:hypothetical protein
METKRFNLGFTCALVGVLSIGGCVARVAGPRAAGLALALGGGGGGGGDKGSAPPFAADSPFNLRIPTSATLDPRSDEMVAYLARKKQANAALYEFAIPIWSADANTPRFSVRCSMSPAWGPCPFAASFVPIPIGAHAHAGSDGAMVIVDRSAGKSYEFWQFRRDGDAWVTSWGTIQDLTGSGWSKNGSSTASGASRLAGVVRVHEIGLGVIGHALVMSIDNSCADIFRAPAVKTDGDSTRPDCTPQGAHLQLDPALDVDTLPGITAAERAVGKALQSYGIYVIDKGGAPMGISFELAPDAESPQSIGVVYKAAGLTWDYFGMPHVPWDRLRVLRQWDGG